MHTGMSRIFVPSLWRFLPGPQATLSSACWPIFTYYLRAASTLWHSQFFLLVGQINTTEFNGFITDEGCNFPTDHCNNIV